MCNNKCIHEGCNENALDRSDYCAEHEAILIDTTELQNKLNTRRKDKICKLQNCDNIAFNSGMCSFHWVNYAKGMSLEELMKLESVDTSIANNRIPCVIRGCNNFVRTNDLICLSHKSYQKRTKISTEKLISENIQILNKNRYTKDTINGVEYKLRPGVDNCAIEGCNKPAWIKARCIAHYTEHTTNSYDDSRFCDEENCKSRKAKGYKYCRLHLFKKLLAPAQKEVSDKVCTVPNCDKKIVGKGLCSGHLAYYRKGLAMSVITSGRTDLRSLIKNKCKHDKCKNIQYSKDGQCIQHYLNSIEYKKDVHRVCMVKGCTRGTRHAQALCVNHLDDFLELNTKEPYMHIEDYISEERNIKGTSTLCGIKGCNNIVTKVGLCNNHYDKKTFGMTTEEMELGLTPLEAVERRGIIIPEEFLAGD